MTVAAGAKETDVTTTRTVGMLTLGLAALLAVSCGGGEEAVTAASSGALEPRPVRLIRPEVRVEQPSLELVGEIRPFDTVAIAAELPGRVDRVLVEVGDAVRAGQPMVEIDREAYALEVQRAEAALAAAEAELALAGKELERKADLASDATISQAALDQAQTARELAAAHVGSARAARDLARRNLGKSVIRAPEQGVVTGRRTSVGAWADVGTVLIEVATGRSVKVAAQVPAEWGSRLAGLEAFRFRTSGDADWRGATVYSVDPVAEGTSRSFTLVGTAPNPQGELRPGSFATVALVAPRSVESLWLPVRAVATSDLPEVMTVEDGRIVVRKVQTGRRSDGSIEVVQGIERDEPFVADVAGLQRGLPVTVEGGVAGVRPAVEPEVRVEEAAAGTEP